MPDTGDTLSFTGILHVGKAGTGAFKLTAQQLGWRCTDKTRHESSVAFSGKDIKSAEWQRVCGRSKGLLKLCFQGGAGVSRFAGFHREDAKALKAHMQKHFGVELVDQPIATAGHSWGEWKIEGDSDLRIMMDGKFGMDLPVGELGQVSSLGKADLNLEFQEDANMAPADEVLHEVRLVIPGVGSPDAPTLSAEQLRDELQRLAGLSSVGEAIARITDVPVVAPRGKHDFEFFAQTVKVHGKTQNYTIKYRNIARIFLLEMPTGKDISVVIGLDQPLRHGQQLHPFLVLNFDKDRKVPLDLPEEKMKQWSVTQGEEHPVYSLVGKLFKELSGKTVVAASSEFKELHPDKLFSVHCTYKAAPGLMFPLKKSFLFVNRPVIWCRYDDIDFVRFSQSQMRRGSFDIVISTRGQEIEFAQIERRYYDCIFEFFQKVNLKIENLREVQAVMSTTARRKGPPAAAQATKAAVPVPAVGGRKQQEEEYDEDADEDFEAESGSAEDDGEESDDGDIVEDDEPARKRPRRGK